MSHRSSLLRERGTHAGARVGMVELFFDLVFVLAVTQLSHALLGNLTFEGAVHTGLLLFAVWWVWIYTSWTTNWLDPERLPVRLCLFALMLAGLLLAIAIPKAFAERGLLFGASYALMHLGRTGFVLWTMRHEPMSRRRNFQRIFVWLCLAGVFWIAGGIAAAETRLLWWLAALAIDLTAPPLFYWVPGLGASQITDWDIDGGHMAERSALFIIIALGESLLVTGATFSSMAWTADTWIALAVSVVGSILMWWIYFDTGAERADHRIRHAQDPGRQARSAYTYIHIVMVAGIIVCAVADELVLAHPHHGSDAAMVTILAGPTIYLLGTALFKWVTNDRVAPPLSHLSGLALLGVLIWPTAAHLISPLWLSTATTAVLLVVATWETVALRSGH